tara:strand:- start:26 stop:478 length:453 start_codon:yes stop_codon:yes gene_type:complete
MNTLSTLTNFSTYDPFFVGFDRIFDQLQRQTSGQSTGYPPYDIIRDGEKYTINIAVAGFSEDDVEVLLKDGELTISGKIESKDSYNPKEVLHQGIAGRKFRRSFTLAETVEVKDVSLKNGILSILLENVIPEDKKPKKFAINKNGKLLTG